MHRETLAIREKVLGSVYCLARLPTNQCHYDESRALYDRAYTAHRVVLGEDHPTTCARYQYRSEVAASQEQSWILPFLQKRITPQT